MSASERPKLSEMVTPKASEMGCPTQGLGLKKEYFGQDASESEGALRRLATDRFPRCLIKHPTIPHAWTFVGDGNPLSEGLVFATAARVEPREIAADPVLFDEAKRLLSELPAGWTAWRWRWPDGVQAWVPHDTRDGNAPTKRAILTAYRAAQCVQWILTP
jgi:hypothetical protein